MDHIDIDVHKRESQIFVLADGGLTLRAHPSPRLLGAGTKPSPLQ